MSHRCLAPEDLASLVPLNPDDPRRSAAEACPRCAALLAEVSAFLAGDPDAPVVELQRADRILADFVAQRIAGPAAGVPVRPRRLVAFPRRRLGAGLAVATAAVLALVFLMPPEDPTPSGIVRGGGHVTGLAPLGGVTIADTTAAGLPQGSLRLAWPPVPQADTYEVVVFGADLDSLATLGPLVVPLVVVPGDLPGLAPGGAFARVRALTDGVPVAESPLAPLALR